MIKLFFVMLLVVLNAGCGAIQTASVLEDEKAKQLKVYPDKSTVYIYRYQENNTQAIMRLMPVPLWVDDKEYGNIGVNSYYHLIMEPGDHSFATESENFDDVLITTKPGTVTYVHIDIEQSLLKPKVSIYESPASISAELLQKCSLLVPTNKH